MKWMIIGLAFSAITTIYFGNNQKPSCDAERYCDTISVAMVFYGIGSSAGRLK